MHSTNRCNFDFFKNGSGPNNSDPCSLAKRKKKNLDPNWEGPFVIIKVYLNGTYLLMSIEGNRIICLPMLASEKVLPIR